ncbi:hypothetical protein GGR74_001556 [Xanthomonas arboricola]
MHIGTLPLASTHSNSAANHRFYDSRFPNPGPQPRIASTVISSRS